jgi:hypothetical protein
VPASLRYDIMQTTSSNRGDNWIFGIDKVGHQDEHAYGQIAYCASDGARSPIDRQSKRAVRCRGGTAWF